MLKRDALVAALWAAVIVVWLLVIEQAIYAHLLAPVR